MAREGLPEYAITPHAAFEMERRGLPPDVVRDILSNPGQRIAARSGRDVFQSIVEHGEVRWLVRVIVDMDRRPPEVVTAYRTSKIEKYWRERP
ncbi:MAG: DUF4258 domain-containing protein [Nitrospinota bacterium]